MFRDGCRRAFQNQPQRLVTPMYSCSIIVSNEVLGEFALFFKSIHHNPLFFTRHKPGSIITFAFELRKENYVFLVLCAHQKFKSVDF